MVDLLTAFSYSIVTRELFKSIRLIFTFIYTSCLENWVPVKLLNHLVLKILLTALKKTDKTIYNSLTRLYNCWFFSFKYKDKEITLNKMSVHFL